MEIYSLFYGILLHLCLTELLVFTVAQYITFFVGSFSVRSCFFILTVALFVGGGVAVNGSNLFIGTLL